jgi:hypothetical protein
MDDPVATFDEIKNELQSGDIILFDGPSWQDEVIEWADSSSFSHVCLVVRLALESGSPEALMVWSADGIDTLADKISGEMKPGTHLLDMAEMLAVSKTRVPEHKHYRFAWRKTGFERTPAYQALLLSTLRALTGTAFPTTEYLISNYYLGRHGYKPLDEGKTLFCSQLAAETFVRTNLISNEHFPNYYSPGSFSEENCELPLMNGMTLGKEQFFTYPDNS